jgi:hypothetical protein
LAGARTTRREPAGRTAALRTRPPCRRAAIARRARRARWARRARPGLAALALVAALALAACGGTARPPTEPAPPPTAGAFTFSQIQSGIFTPSCAKAGCHVSAVAAGSLVLEAGRAYANIVGRRAPEQSQLDLVRPGNPEASYLLKKVRGDADITGSRMPQDGPPFLSSRQIAGLAAWIQAGAPNN